MPNIIAINLTTFEFQEDMNERLRELNQESDEFVTDFKKTQQQTIYVLTKTVKGASTETLYYQTTASTQFHQLNSRIQSIDLYFYKESFFTLTNIVALSLIAFLLFILLIVLIIPFLKKSRNFNNSYISIPDFNEGSIQNNLDLILNDESIPKIGMDSLLLGDLIGSGGQSIVRRAKYKGKGQEKKTFF
jgi:hypothetical protein